MKNLLLIAIMMLVTNFVSAQYMYDGNGKRIGCLDGEFTFNESNTCIGIAIYSQTQGLLSKTIEL
jgi:hypothetical protein